MRKGDIGVTMWFLVGVLVLIAVIAVIIVLRGKMGGIVESILRVLGG